MRRLLTLLFLYLLFLIQAVTSPFGPDFLLLALFFLALHEDRLAVTLLAFFSGLCLDLLYPPALGANALIYSGLAYGAATLRTMLYRSHRYAFGLVLVGLLLKQLVLVLAGVGLPGFVPLGVSSVLTLVLVLPADRVVARLFPRSWKPG